MYHQFCPLKQFDKSRWFSVSLSTFSETGYYRHLFGVSTSSSILLVCKNQIILPSNEMKRQYNFFSHSNFAFNTFIQTESELGNSRIWFSMWFCEIVKHELLLTFHVSKNYGRQIIQAACKISHQSSGNKRLNLRIYVQSLRWHACCSTLLMVKNPQRVGNSKVAKICWRF